MSGRCIGIARLVCDALAMGYTTEVLHLVRALHEADRLAAIFPQPEGADLLRKWLVDEGHEWVRPREVRDAQEKLYQRINRLGGPDIEAERGLPREIYGMQSQAAHHHRKWTQDAVAPLLRTMLTGTTTVWQRRAATAAAMLPVVGEAVVSVGDALGEFMPPQWWISHVKPFVDAFETLRLTLSLEECSSSACHPSVTRGFAGLAPACASPAAFMREPAKCPSGGGDAGRAAGRRVVVAPLGAPPGRSGASHGTECARRARMARVLTSAAVLGSWMRASAWSPSRLAHRKRCGSASPATRIGLAEGHPSSIQATE